MVNSTATSTTFTSRFAAYVPVNGQGAPYVYFASANYAAGTATGYNLAQGGTGVCKPYFQDSSSNVSATANYVYANPSSFQIISAGLDGNYGVGNCSYPSGGTTYGPSGVNAYGPYDLDNLANFSPAGNLGTAVPVNQ